MAEKEYIEREALIDTMQSALDALPKGAFNPNKIGFAAAIEGVKNFPAADVRPVARCKECVHRHDRNRQSCQGRRPDFFCADGERITNGFNIADKNEKLSATMNIMEES